uniref:BED-type domain-containing protein n=1 Tax=Leptobrachium leishanense TaxID=445787 RepID=A0A8C5WL28_9ANUR
MPHEGEDHPMACKSTLHLAFPRQGTGPTERDLIPAETPIESSESVPQIEMKLESSDEEDEEFEKSEPCPFPQIRKSPGVDMRVLLMCQKGKGNASDGGKGDLVDDLPRSSAAPPGQFAVRPIRKRKAKSEVWQFFYRDANNVCRAVCSICRISVSRGKLGGNFGTTALKRHLESKHPMEWAQRESMRLQRRDEEDEETFEEKEPNERSFNDPIMEYHFKEASKYGAMGSSETYEIIDSSDDGEDVDKVQGQGAQVELDEEIEMKGLKVLTREDLKKMNRYRGLPIDSGAKLSIGMAHATSSATAFFCNRDLPLAPPETKKRRSTSAVWQFFYIDHENTCRAICTLCHLSVSRGTRGSNLGTSALIRHLEVKHPLEWGKVKSDKPKIFGIIEVEDEEEEPDEPIELYAQQQQTPSGLQSLADCSEYSESSANLAPEPPAGPLEYDPRVVIGKSEKLLSSEDPHMVFNHNDLTRNGKYTPSHQKAQAWNQNIAELVCGLALPYSFINSRAFQMFMQRADPLYSLPPKSFFSGKAIPQMFDAVCKQVAGELKRSECPHVHVAAHVWSMDLPMNFLALSAHWAVFDSGDQPSISRKHAVLCVKSFPKEFNESNIQQELVRQVNLWLSPNTLCPGFFISSGDFSLIHAIKGANFSYVSSFPHSLNLLILDFFQSNRFITGMLAVARKVCSHFAHSAWAGKRLRELQHQYNLPKHSLKQETVQHWTSTFYMLQRLLEQQRAVQEYLAKHTLEVADDLLTPSHWKLMITLVYLLQPFEMATREANAKDCSLSQVLPGIRYLHIFLRQIRGHFEGKGDSAGWFWLMVSRLSSLRISG